MCLFRHPSLSEPSLSLSIYLHRQQQLLARVPYPSTRSCVRDPSCKLCVPNSNYAPQQFCRVLLIDDDDDDHCGVVGVSPLLIYLSCLFVTHE